MFEDTKFKLEEAKYFYSGMEELFIRSSDAYIFYLNGFLGAAKNVGWVLESDFTRAKGKQGYDKWAATNKSHGAEVFQKFTHLRNVSAKQRSITNIRRGPIRIETEANISGAGTVNIQLFTAGQPLDPAPKFIDNGIEKTAKVSAHYEFEVREKYKNKDLVFENFLAESRNYLKLIEEMIASAVAETSKH